MIGTITLNGQNKEKNPPNTAFSVSIHRLIWLLLIFIYFYASGSFVAHAQAWKTLDSLGQVLIKKQRFEEADSVLKLALKNVEALHGKDTNYTKVVNNINHILFSKGAYDKAELNAREIMLIDEKYHGKKSGYYARACSNLGILYKYLGLYEKAEPLYLEAKNIRKEIYGATHTEYALSCITLASLYKEQGVYDKAEALYFEVKQIYKEVKGVQYARLCNNLASLYFQQGYYDKAEQFILEAKAIFGASSLGKKDLDYAGACNNLAALYQMQGLFRNAEPLYLQAQDIWGAVLGKKHPKYATVCDNLADLYRNQGAYDKIEPLLLIAKGIREEVLGKKHPEYGTSCNNLAVFYELQGLYDKAELSHLEAKKLHEEVVGKKHPFYANSCNNLGHLYYKKGDTEKAEQLCLEAKTIVEEVLGKKHPKYTQLCSGLAKVYHAHARYDNAEWYSMEVLANMRDEIQTFFPSLSEQEKNEYWQSASVFFKDFIKLCKDYSAHKPSIVATLYDQTLFTKGIIFSSTQKMKNAILNSGDTLLANQYRSWKKQRETYTKLYQMPLEEQKKQKIDLESMNTEINQLEKALSKKSMLFGQNVQTKSYKWQEVKAKLAKDELVIEIIASDSAYIALFLSAYTENYPEFYIFENAKDLEKRYLNFYNNCIQYKIDDSISYSAFWKPIADKILILNKKGFKKIYFSPDGVYHQISLNTLKNPKTGQFLLQEADIQIIGSSRDLIELNNASKNLSQHTTDYQAYMLGYPLYGNPEGKKNFEFGRAAGFSGVQAALGVAGSVSLLPGTKKEVENVFALFKQKKLKVNLLLAENATEEAVKKLKSPTILHVATHGFFIPEIPEREVMSIQDAMNRNLLKNPLMRSGLLLAGCQKPNPEGEDGILTAEEAMNLTLDNTELVVMSACETGLGDIQAGEGVFGLQRAFQQAGAKSVLMSLWKVDDEATQTLMTKFYTALLKGQSKRQAFKTAQMTLKKRFPEPYYWGAFVMVGE